MGPCEVWVCPTGDEVRVYWGNGLHISVQNGSCITVDTPEDISDTFVDFALMGVGIGILLHQRDVFALHASAVSIEGRTAVFVGQKGEGKSTTSIALGTRPSCEFICDDVVALHIDDQGRAWVWPDWGMAKLRPQVAEYIFGDEMHQMDLVDFGDEGRYIFQDGRVEGPRQVDCIYKCEFDKERSEGVEIVPINKRQSMVELLKNSYAPRFLGDSARPDRYMEYATSVTNAVSLKRLVRPYRLDIIPEVGSQIDSDLAHSVGDGT